MNPAWPGPLARDAGEPNHAAERVVHHAGGNPSVPCRKEHMVVSHDQPAARVEVAVKRSRDRGMRRDKPALPEFCPPDQQNSIGSQVIKPQIRGLRDAQACRGNESEECRVHLASEG
jgi:hypothetical protein